MLQNPKDCAIMIDIGREPTNNTLEETMALSLNELAANLKVTREYQPIIDILPNFIKQIDKGVFDEDPIIKSFKVLGIPFSYLSISTYTTRDGTKKNQICKPGLWLDSATGGAILLYGFSKEGKKAYVIPTSAIFLPESKVLISGQQIAYIPLKVMENVNLYLDAIKVIPALKESGGGFAANVSELIGECGNSGIVRVSNPKQKQNGQYTFSYVDVDGLEYQVPKGCYSAITVAMMTEDSDFVIGEFFDKKYNFQGKEGITSGFRLVKEDGAENDFADDF